MVLAACSVEDVSIFRDILTLVEDSITLERPPFCPLVEADTASAACPADPGSLCNNLHYFLRPSFVTQTNLAL